MWGWIICKRAWRFCLTVLIVAMSLNAVVLAANVSNQNAAPNPFNPSVSETTTISYDLANSSLLWLRVYDTGGVLRRNLVAPGNFNAANRTAGAGKTEIWDGRDNASAILSNGDYPYHIDAAFFVSHTSTASTGQDVQDIAVDPSNPNIVWSLNKGSAYVFRSTNGGTSFSPVSGTGADAKAYGIAISNNGQTIYIANEGQDSLIRSTNGGSSWGRSAALPSSQARGVATSSDGSIVYVSASGGSVRDIYKSVNGGANWSICSLSGVALSDDVRGLATDATGTTLLIVDSGNDRILRSTNGCSSASVVPNISSGSGTGQLSSPYQVELLNDGKFWVSDRNNYRIQQYDANGNVLMVYGGTALGTGNYQFDFGNNKYPGLEVATIADQAYIFVADYKNQRIKRIGFDNWVSSTDIVIGDNAAPVGGFTVDEVIPAGQINQATDGSGVISVSWKARDDQSDSVTLNTFQYSDDGGTTWYTPNNGDGSAALSVNWNDNGGAGWATATTFAAATAHSFSFNTQHPDVTVVQSLDNIDQSDIQIRFTVNDGTANSINPVASDNVRVDNLAPNNTIVSGAYNDATNTLVITGTNFTSIAPVLTDIRTLVDWSRFIWDINGDDGVTANIGFVLADVSSLTITNATTLTLVFTPAKAAVIEATAGYGVAGGADTLDVTAGFSIDAFGNVATTDAVSNALLSLTNTPPVGGFTVDDVIPAAQISQATDGNGVITINWKARDDQSDNVSLNTFQYSDDGGITWYTPSNGDASTALSTNWNDNGGAGWATATTFAAATAHSFSFNTQHPDVTAAQSLDNVDQSDIQIRFIVNDGSVNSVSPAISESVQVDNLVPNNTIISGAYNDATDTLILTGTNFTSIAPVSTDIRTLVDWSRLIWDINGDDAVTANIGFVLADVSSLTVTNATTLTLVFTGAKATAIEATAGYGAAGGADTLDITAGFSIDAFGNAATTDALNNGALAINSAPVGGFSVDNVIPVTQISQATDGSGVITINWKARDDQSDNVTLHTFQYSDDGGLSWQSPNNNDASAALSLNWNDNGAAGWTSATTFAAASAHSFTFNTRHPDVTAARSLDNVDQSDIQIRFTVNDGETNSLIPATSENLRVDNFAPNNTFVSSTYNADTNTFVLTGTNFTSIAPASTDIRALVDWSRFVWDINGDNGGTADITFVLADITSLTVTNATTLTLLFTPAKAAAIEATAGYGAVGGADTLDITAGFSIDAFGNVATTDVISNAPLSISNTPPVGGFTVDNVIPTTQISQATDGSGVITINWKARDDQSDNVTLNTFQYSDDGGITWYTPNNGDASTALSINWNDNGGANWTSATTFAAATAHSFSFNTQHPDISAVQSLDNVDQSDIQIRFTVNDGTVDSVNPTASENVQVDNLAPNNTIVSGAYNDATNTLVITGTNFTSVAPVLTDIRTLVDWSRFVWDINGDDAVTANIGFVLADVSSLTITNATTLTLVFTPAKAAAIEATVGYGVAGGADTLDLTAGFSIDAFGNTSITDAVSNAPLSLTNTPPVGGFTVDDVIPAAQISQATDGSGLITINWKARDDQSDNVSLNTFQYSDDGGITWYTPSNGDASAALSVNWNDNGGAGWTTATSFAAAIAHSFSFNTQHPDVTAVQSLNNVDQSDIQIRFTVNDGSVNSVNPATSESVQVDNLAPTNTIVSGVYNDVTNTLVLSGTNFTSIAPASTDIRNDVDWSRFIWDINGDDAVTANIGFVLADVSSLTITNANTLTLVFTPAKAATIEATAGYGIAGGADTLDITAGFSIDAFGNAATTDGVSNATLAMTNTPPVGGFTIDNVIPAGQISQATDGSGVITINWKVRDDQSDDVTLNTFQYSDDGGVTWYTPNNGDTSASLSVNWNDNGGAGWATATTFAAATAHSFTFNTRHSDVASVQSLDNVDQSDVQIRFIVNDGNIDSVSPAISESVQIDNLAPSNTIVSGVYNSDTDTLVVTGTNFTSIAPVSTDIRTLVDWSRFIWDINGDDALTANVSFVLADITSLSITDAATLTLVFTSTKAAAIEATAGYGVIGGADTLDVAAGFSIDAFGNAATTDGISNAPLAMINTPPIGGFSTDDVIPATQINQATDGSGLLTINWKARDDQSDNVTLNTFQYSDDGGVSWHTPNNGDASAALSVNWNTNGGAGWATATTFAAATAHSFSFNTQHPDVTAVQSLDNVDQSDIQIRFTVNDSAVDSVNPATSESVQVDNLVPNNTIVSGAYNSDADTLVITGTNFTSIAPAMTDIRALVDWSRFVWDINGDDAITADIPVVLGDVASLTVTNATTLTLVFTPVKAATIEATAGYGAVGGADTLDVTAGFSIDVFGNVAGTDGVSDAPLDFAAPVGGFVVDDIIPASQISQATDGSGVIGINWKARDNQSDNVTLNTFQYSDDGGVTWFTPSNGDTSAALSANWNDNGGAGWATATTFAAATAHSFSFNTQHPDVTAVQSLNGVDQSDIQIRFTINDGGADSVNPATSESVQVDNLAPNNTIVSSIYDADIDTLVITGTNFTSIAPALTDIKALVDWSRVVWDINGDDAVTANIGFVLVEVSSLTVTNATTLTLVFTGAKATAIEATAGYGAAGGVDTLDITAGFSIDAFGNAATTDAVSNGVLFVNSAPVGGFIVDDVLPAGQISQATDGSGVISVSWKARDDQSDNVTINSFQYSDDGGTTWYTPNNGDASTALSTSWNDNGGAGWTSATTFAAASAHSFTFNTRHPDVTAARSLDNVDQSDIQIRFTVNDGTVDSVNPTASENVQVDNFTPNNTIVSGAYNDATDTLTLTGTNFTSIAPVSTDIRTLVDWSRFVWDINGDDAITANIGFVLADVSSLTITNATTLTLVFTPAKAAAIEATVGYGVAGGADTLDLTAGFSIDAFGNTSITDAVSNAPLSLTNTPPVGGFTVDDVIPAAQISQATDGSGLITINWKARDDQSDNVSLNTFQYSDDGGITWYTPSNGDASVALLTNWNDNGGANWTTATTFAAAIAHSFSFNTQHPDVTAVQSLDNVDQADIQIRFTVNDGSVNSVSPATSESVQVDNLVPNNTIVSGAYNDATNALVITGTNFTSIAPVSTDIRTMVDWSRFVWDINGDDAVTADIAILLSDVASLTITNATTLTLVFTPAKAAAIEATAGYGIAGGADTLDISAGFSIDAFGNAATTDALNNGALAINSAPVGGFSVDNVIPAIQISQATDGSGLITINWKARDDQSDNVTLNTFQYSDDGGITWYTPTNGDASAALSANWNDNGGANWTTATTFAAATTHSFSFNTQHPDVTAVQSLDNNDQSDIQVRFTVNDGETNALAPAVSENIRIDNLAPNNTFVSGTYDADTNALILSGTNVTSIAPTSTDIRTLVDWSRFVWDINGDNGGTADITFVLADITSLTVTNATTLTLLFTPAKAAAIEATAGYGAIGGADTLDITAGFSIDAFGNVATADAISNAPLSISNTPSVGGFTVDDVIPSTQISQATDGSGVITINWKARDDQSDNVTLNTFQYSDDSGITWYTPNNGDTSTALSTNWNDNAGANWTSATTFAAATAHSFSFNTQHPDISAVQSLDNIDQTDIQIRFTVNDGSVNSVNPATSDNVQVDNLAPNNIITSGAYNDATDTLILTGTNFTSIAPVSTDIRTLVDWSRFVWDINGDDAVTADIAILLSDVDSFTITNATTLTLSFTPAKAAAIEATAGYGAAGGADTLDITTGFSIDAFGNVSITDALSNGALAVNSAAVGGFTVDDVIPAAQISQATDGSGLVTINWKARDNQSDNVTLNSFQYSDDGGITWYTPNNGDASAALSTTWNDNGGAGWATATTFALATAHGFTFNTRHADVNAVQSLDNVDQSDIQVRFIVNDGNVDSVNPVISEDIRVDNLDPNNTIVSGAYSDAADTLVITGTNFTSIAPISTDIRTLVDWSRIVWDINGDNAVTADISILLSDVSSLTITNANTLTLAFTPAKAAAIEATAGYGAAGGPDTLDVTAGFSIDAFGNAATTDAVSDALLDFAAPVGGFSVDNVIPAAQIFQATNGSGVITINWKARDDQSDNVNLHTFQYSDDSGVTWYTPNNGDATTALSTNWNDNGGANWATATTFAAATAHSFSFNTQHADVVAVQSLDNIDQIDIQIRFTVNDGSVDSINPATSDNLQVDNLAPNNTIISGAYNDATDTLILTGTNFTSIAPVSTDIRAMVEWSSFVWDINGDDAVTADISILLSDVGSLIITDAATLMLVFTPAKAAAIESTAGYGVSGGADTIDIIAGFSRDAFGNTATSDGLSDGPFALANTLPVGGYSVDDVISATQISQATDGTGLISISWKARDDQVDNVTLNTFQYSDDGGLTWYTPNNGDASAALSINWNDNGGAGWTTATTFTAATAHNFSFNSKHADVTAVRSLDDVDQSDIRIRFIVNDGSIDSANSTISDSVRIDNLAPDNTISSSEYNDATNTLVIRGANFASIASVGTDIKDYVDWSKLVWDVNSDDGITSDIAFSIADVTSLIITNDTTLTLAFSDAKGSAIETTPNFGAAGGADSLDIAAGFSIDAFGNVSNTDAVSNGLLIANTSISGAVFSDDDELTPLAGETVRLLINGVDSGLTDVTDLRGAFRIVTTASPGDLVLVYLDSGGGSLGTTVSVSNGLSFDTANIFQDHIVVRNDDAGVVNNAILDSAANADGDIQYSVALGNLTVTGVNELFVPSGHSFVPGGDVTTPSMENRGSFNGETYNIDINGNLNISGGNFVSTGATLSVEGDFTVAGGTFNHNNGSVVFDGGVQNLIGSATFNDFSKTDSVDDATDVSLVFDSNATQTIVGALTLDGLDDDDRINLVSANPGSRWNINLAASATKAIDFIDVSDSDASSSDGAQIPVNPIDALNSGNNIQWFSDAVSAVVAEIDRVSIPVGAVGYEFNYDLLPTISPDDTGINLVTITAPDGYANLVVNAAYVGGVEQAVNCPSPGSGQYCATIIDQAMTVAFGTKVTTSDTNVRVSFTADAPTAIGSGSFTAIVDDSDTTQTAPQSAVVGDADADPSDANSQTVSVIGFNGLEASTLIADPQIVVADGVATSTLTATLLDNDSAAVTGKVVTFASDRSAFDVVNQPAVLSDIEGIAVGNIRSTMPGVVMVSATDVTDGITLSEQAQIYFSQGLVLDLTKTANKEEVVVGDIVTYQVEIKNTTTDDITLVALEDVIPPNFKYIKGSARIDGALLADPDGNRHLLFEVGTVPALVDANSNGQADLQEEGYRLLSYQLIVGAGATPGNYVNTIYARDVCDACMISNTANEAVEVVLDPFFDLGTILGKVFNDKNSDGWQDEGEDGVAGVMVVLDDGTYVLTDSHGRYHFPAVTPGQRMLKINAQSLPSGSKFTTPVNQVLSVTPGLLVKANFGVIDPSELRKIGSEGESSANITRNELNESTVDVYGSVAMQNLFVNGTEIPVSKADVEMYTSTITQDVLDVVDGALNDVVGFRMFTNRSPDTVKNWELQILTPKGEVLRRFEGGALRDAIAWDGHTEHGVMLTGGVYHYQFFVEFWDGNRASSPRRMFSANERSLLAVNMTGNTFELGSTTLSASAKESLRGVADALRKYTDGKIYIDGHTDSLGSADKNMEISKARAEAAAKYLVEIERIPRARLDVRGFGETQPVADNDTPEQRSLNRRIRVHGNIGKRALAKTYRRFTVEPSLNINDAQVGIDKFYSFRETKVLSEAENLAIVMNDRFGRSSLTHLYAPKLTLPNQGEGESYRIVFPPKGDQSSGVAVSEYHLEGTTVPGSAIEFDGRPVKVAEDGTFRHKIGLPPGRSTHNLVVTAPSGYTRFSSFELTAVSHDEAGRPLYLVDPVPALELDVPQEGARVKSKIYTVSGKTDPKNAVYVEEEEIEVEADGSFAHTMKLKRGHNLISVRAVNPEGFVGRVEHSVVASSSDLFFMAFADGKFGQLRGEGYLEGAGMQAQTEYYNEGRVAYYLKGQIQGKYLITSAFDSGKQEIDKLFDGLDEQDSSKLFTELDPDKLYPVYGDSSTLVNDVESQGKFYLALESDEINAVIGNYAINLNDTELAGFQRTLYGAHFKYQSVSSSMNGRPDTEVVIFGAQVKQAPVHDELSATGGSLYYLSHSDIIEGSEQVTVVVRDKNTGLTLSRTVLQRNIDYRIYYDQGRLVTSDPVASVVEDRSLFDDSLLSGNPVSLEVSYEAELNSFEKKVMGARVSKTLTKNIAVGATQINDELNEGEYELLGLDAEMRIGRAVRVLTELAESSGIDGQTYLSLDGGLTFNNVTPGGELSGNAWKVAVELDVGELLDDPGRMFVDVYAKRLSSGFLSQGNFLERGTHKAGIGTLYSFSSQSKLQLSYTTEESDMDISNPAAITNIANLSLQWRYIAEKWEVTTEYQGRDMKDAAGKELERDQYVTAQVRYQLTEKTSTHLERQQTITGDENSQTTLGADYQVSESTKMTGSVVQGTQGKAAKAGVQWLFDGGKLYLDERLTRNAVGESSLSTVVGGENQLGANTRIYSEYQIDNADSGDKRVSLLGVDRFWQLQRGLLFKLAGEHSVLNGDISNTERYALSLSLSYKGQSGFAWATKNEFRREQGDKELLQYLSHFLIEQKLNPDYTLLFKYQLSQTKNKTLGTIEADFNEHSIGLAYRPVASDRLNLLARYTSISDKRPLNLGQVDSHDTQIDVLSVEWSYDLTRMLEWVDKLAIKRRAEESKGYAPTVSHTALSIHRLNLKVTDSWYVGAEYRILAQREADSRRKGWLTEVMWRANEHMRLGVGYNFTHFSDNEYSENDYSVKGIFMRLQGTY